MDESGIWVSCEHWEMGVCSQGEGWHVIWVWVEDGGG